ncbi:Hypothetical protein CINCED_3A022251 [Cinara cedri]|uniref:Uncharacterized protein n=1 Tax=Cinara cedri TaxID=506608 RepID=A0A5E4N6Q4_9HEMI|nr:Hypothetical protein CINCED_3A022251 [Cinara cedri]
MFVNDIALIEHLGEVNNRLEKWRLGLGGKGLNVNRSYKQSMSMEKQHDTGNAIRGYGRQG